MKKSLLTLLFVSLSFSCQDDESVDCSTVLCVGPPSLLFEVLLNGENVFEEGIYTVDDVSLTGNTPAGMELRVGETNFGNRTVQLLYLENIDWEVTSYDFILQIATHDSTELMVEIQLSSGQCCGGIPQIINYQIDGTIQVNPNSVATLNLN